MLLHKVLVHVAGVDQVLVIDVKLAETLVAALQDVDVVDLHAAYRLQPACKPLGTPGPPLFMRAV